MNRQLGVLLAIGAVVGIAAVTGVAVLDDGGTGPAQNTTDTPTDATAQQVNGTAVATANGTLTLRAAEGQAIAGRTDVAAGESLTVRLQSVGDAATPFLRSTGATVRDDGTFETTVDLSTLTGQPAFELRVRHDGETLTAVDGRVVGNATDPVGDTAPAESDDWEPVDDTETAPVGNASFLVDGERVALEPTADASLAAQTDLDAGTQVEVRLRSTSGSSPFLKTQSATVEPDGTIRASFNMTGVATDTTFEATVDLDGTTLARHSGVVTA